jgi:hypothetical protein
LQPEEPLGETRRGGSGRRPLDSKQRDAVDFGVAAAPLIRRGARRGSSQRRCRWGCRT